MKAVRRLLPLLILPWVLSAASLHLKKRVIEPKGRAVGIESPGPRWLGGFSAGRSHLILQFRHAMNEQMVQELNARGAYVVGMIPDFGVMVSVRDDFSLDGLSVEWAGRLEMGDKISALLENSRAEGEIWLVAEFFPDVDMGEARRLAEAAGFRVHAHPDLLANHLLLSGPAGRLEGLAQWDEVSYLFPASRALIRGERVNHCAGALATGSTAGNGATTQMYVTASSGWAPDSPGGRQVTLSYVFGALTPELDASQTMQAILGSLNAWTAYAPVKFVPGGDATAARTLYIRFAEYDHGDGLPFDGPGGILAHTFYPAPPNAESIAGDMHFDGSESWRIGANTDLATVALHEAGHALGLAHVDNPQALMYPYYQLGSKIAAGDIEGVQSIYGGAASPLTLTISTPAANSTTTASTMAIAGTTSGGQGNVQVTWQASGGASGTATGTATWSATSVPLSVGSNTITVTATAGSTKAVQTVTATRTSAASNTPPSLTITSPVGSTVATAAATVTIKGTASDNAGVTRVTWQTATASGTASGTASWTAGNIPLLVGDNTITVRAYDAAGNSSSKSLLVIRN